MAILEISTSLNVIEPNKIIFNQLVEYQVLARYCAILPQPTIQLLKTIA